MFPCGFRDPNEKEGDHKFVPDTPDLPLVKPEYKGIVQETENTDKLEDLGDFLNKEYGITKISKKLSDLDKR